MLILVRTYGVLMDGIVINRGCSPSAVGMIGGIMVGVVGEPGYTARAGALTLLTV